MTTIIILPTAEVIRALVTPTSKLYSYYWCHYLTAPGRYIQGVCEAYWEGWSRLFEGRK